MASGFEVYDTNNKLQLTSGLLTYSLRVSGTTYVEARKIGNTCPNTFLIPTSATYNQALIAISGGNGYAAAFGGTYYMPDGSRPKIYGTNGAPVGTAFNYYIFERSNTIPATNFGLEVRKEDTNEIVFSSSQRVMSVVDLIGGVVNNGEQAVTYGGRQLAWCQGAWSGHRISGEKVYYGGGGGGGGIRPTVPDQDNPGQGSYSGWRNDGKIYGGYSANNGQSVGTRMVSWDDVQIGPGPDQDQPPDFYTPLNLFVVDVTGVPIGQTFY